MGLSFVEFSRALSSSLKEDVSLRGEDEMSFDLMLSLLALNFANRGHFSNAEVRVATERGVHHATDIDDALRGMESSNTRFGVGSFRVYLRNHDEMGNIPQGGDIPNELSERLLQVRFLQSWLGDHNGEPEEKVARLSSIMHANQNMQMQIREKFAMIDNRKVARERLTRAQWNLQTMPIDRVVVQLQERQATQGLVRRLQKETIIDLLEMDIMYTLGRTDDMLIRNSVGKVVWQGNLSNMQSNNYLRNLPEKIEKAYNNFR